MERKYKLTIPEPCTENWDKMTPNENGRYCISCSKTVVDFTSMLPNEVQHFFIQNQNKKICGRFKNSQLDTINIQIPSRILHNQTYYHKMFLLALFIAMGTTLFSCQDKNGNKQKINKVEVVQDDVPVEHISVGDPKINNLHDTIVPPPPPPKVDQVKFVKPKENDNLKSEKTENKRNSAAKVAIYASTNGEVLSETNAEFPGGIEQFYNFFEKEFKKPENINTKNLKINLSFAVEKNGSVSYLQCVPSIDILIEKEIIRVLSTCPKWLPGAINGKKVKRQYSLPIVLQ
ncbi:hypothetical protein [Flavobacterium sp. LC2016-12]|uniref:hypothetical protein n=1 Tax=Flavobacterium sp. LC2016-12 TaxID=2783794 RepID=UPI00188DA059|nr:hypothetical protein [Flavobacterium sp. LC2016-12]MBF4467085.1 hypothetical protein [Flavobacterium sp. LC2016-12]